MTNYNVQDHMIHFIGSHDLTTDDHYKITHLQLPLLLFPRLEPQHQIKHVH